MFGVTDAEKEAESSIRSGISTVPPKRVIKLRRLLEGEKL